MGSADRDRSVAQLDGSPRRRYYTGRDLQRAIAVADLRAIAHRRLPRFVLEYLEGGAGEEATLLRERTAYAAWCFTHLLVPGGSVIGPSRFDRAGDRPGAQAGPADPGARGASDFH